MKDSVTSWRAFTGQWAVGGAARSDEVFPTWVAARDSLLAEVGELATFEDDCPHCLGQALDAQAALTEAVPDGQWLGNIDGTDYVLLPVDKGKGTT